MSVLAAMAQGQRRTVSGRVFSSTGEELVNAVVMFKDLRDSTKIYHSVCDAGGCYNQELPYGRYSCTVSFLGECYIPDNNVVSIYKQNTVIPDIRISLKEEALDEVTVVAKRPFVSYSGSKARYNLSANPASVGGTLSDGIKLIPGIQVKESGGLSVFGFYNLKVAVNGRILRLSNEEIQAYVASMSVADVEAVEIIRNPGPEYGAGGDAVLNIITKKNSNAGLNAFVSADVVYRTALSQNALMRVNLNTGKWVNYVSYRFFNTHRMETLTTTIGADTTKIAPHNGHNVQAGSEYRISTGQIVGARALLSLSKEHINYKNTNRTGMDRKVGTVNLYHLLSLEKWNWRNYADYTFSSNDRNYFYKSATGSNFLQDKFHYLRMASDLSFSATPQLGITVGGSLNNTWFTTASRSGHRDADYSYKECNTYAYLALRYHNDSFDTYGGVQFNHDMRSGSFRGRKSGTDNICNWQPYFSFTYNISRNHRLVASLQTYYDRPSFRDLMPYASHSGFLYRLGNSGLKNSKRYNISLSYSYMRAATIELSFSNEKDPVVEYLTPYKGGYALTKTNLDNSRYMRIVTGAPIPVIYKEDGLQWVVSTYVAYHIQRDRGAVNSLDYNHTFQACYVQHKQSLNLPSQWYFDAQITYYSPLSVGVYKTEKQWWTDFTVSRRVRNWRFSVSGYDIFNTNVAKGRIEGMKDQVSFVQNWHSPKITFGISCTFGNKDLKTYNRKSVNSESRLNRSANEGINLQSH